MNDNYFNFIIALYWGLIMVEDCEIKDQMIKCEFCGFTFQRCDGISCDSCPINCKTVKCPNCGYEILPESIPENRRIYPSPQTHHVRHGQNHTSRALNILQYQYPWNPQSDSLPATRNSIRS